MNHLTRSDYARALQLLAQVEPQTGDEGSFARAVVLALHDYLGAELTTLSVCNLVTRHRGVGSLPDVRPRADEIACFDRHFFEHPLVRHHGFEGCMVTRRVSDLLSGHDLQRSALYGDYCQRLGLEYTIALPLVSEHRTLVSVVLNRRGLDFDQRDRERLDLLRPHLAFLYGQARRAIATPLGDPPPLAPPMPPDPTPPGLTLREAEVMHWLARGKTDAEIAALLSISPSTVQKHLEHVYVKLGVETRTAAVMRSLASSHTPAARQRLAAAAGLRRREPC